MEQGGGDTGIHAPAQAEDDPFAAGLGLDFLDGLAGEMAHGPLAATAADAVDEIGDDFPPPRSVGHFGVKLQAVKIADGFLDGGKFGIVGGGDGLEAPGNPGEFVAVGVPNLQRPGQVGEERGGGILDVQCALAVFAFLAGFDLAAEKMGEQLHAVADAEDGEAQIENAGVRHGGVLGINAGRAAG